MLPQLVSNTAYTLVKATLAFNGPPKHIQLHCRQLLGAGFYCLKLQGSPRILWWSLPPAKCETPTSKVDKPVPPLFVAQSSLWHLSLSCLAFQCFTRCFNLLRSKFTCCFISLQMFHCFHCFNFGDAVAT